MAKATASQLTRVQRERWKNLHDVFSTVLQHCDGQVDGEALQYIEKESERCKGNFNLFFNTRSMKSNDLESYHSDFTRTLKVAKELVTKFSVSAHLETYSEDASVMGKEDVSILVKCLESGLAFEGPSAGESAEAEAGRQGRINSLLKSLKEEKKKENARKRKKDSRKRSGQELTKQQNKKHKSCSRASKPSHVVKEQNKKHKISSRASKSGQDIKQQNKEHQAASRARKSESKKKVFATRSEQYTHDLFNHKMAVFPPPEEYAELTTTCPAAALMLYHENSGNTRYRGIETLPRASQVPGVLDKDNSIENVEEWMDCPDWTEEERKKAILNVKNLVQEIRGEFVTALPVITRSQWE